MSNQLLGILSNKTPVITGYLSNTTLRGIPVEIRLSEDFVLQWKYLDKEDWIDLIDLSEISYEALGDLPQINGTQIIGNKSSHDFNLASQHEGITSITRDGLVFTVTRADGTTFTFDQQDFDTLYEEATQSAAGLMSSADKTKLDGIEDGSQVNLVESISVNGNAQTITGKNVDIAVPLVDATLANSGESADAKATGDAINAVSNTLTQTASTIRSEFRAADTAINNIITQTAQDIRDEIATKQDTLPFATPTAQDVGKALMPKTIENGEVTEWEFGEAGKVDDVQVDGVSILENKVANIPVANGDTPGVVRLAAEYGLNAVYTYDADTGISKTYAGILPPSNVAIKEGTNQMNPIVPKRQHISTFYGLAKAAGHDEKDSELPTGTYSDEAKTAIKNMIGVEEPVDVQINGTSITENGVANIPIGGENLGVVKINSDKGIQISKDGTLLINPTLGAAKYGDEAYKPIVPYIQHYSTFYGLAKAAGHDEKASTLPVGQYTDEAKTAIQTMLGVDTAIADAISGITGFEFQVVTELPATGAKGVIYLVSHSHGTNDGYDEYIWVNNGFEKLGHTDIDLSNYVTFDDYATNNSAGVVKVAATYGIRMENGVLRIDEAASSIIKQGTDPDHPIVSKNQHEATFYGLAKSAGDTTQSQSSNAVGTYTDEAKSAIQTMLGVPSEDDVVTDVQVNGTSVVTDGVADIPVASNSNFGAVKVFGSTTGIQISDGVLAINGANEAAIKQGSYTTLQPIIPAVQYMSTFYGLAEAAGDTTQKDSSNAVGTYTAEAKTSIQNMLGIPEAVASAFQDGIEITVSGTTPTITAAANTRYKCGEVTSLTFNPPAEGVTEVIFSSGSTPTALTLPATVKMPEWFVIESGYTYAISIENATYGTVTSWQT